MIKGKLYSFKIFGRDAIILDQKMEVSVLNQDEATNIVMKVSSSLMDRKIQSLKITFPNKIILIKPVGTTHLSFMADETNKKTMN